MWAQSPLTAWKLGRHHLSLLLRLQINKKAIAGMVANHLQLSALSWPPGRSRNCWIEWKYQLLETHTQKLHERDELGRRTIKLKHEGTFQAPNIQLIFSMTDKPVILLQLRSSFS